MHTMDALHWFQGLGLFQIHMLQAVQLPFEPASSMEQLPIPVMPSGPHCAMHAAQARGVRSVPYPRSTSMQCTVVVVGATP